MARNIPAYMGVLRGALVATMSAALLVLASQPDARAGERDASQMRDALLASADADRGRALFVSKGCVLCHQINGIGGRVAATLDATDDTERDPIEIVANMWAGAELMISLQYLQLGYEVGFTGAELTDLLAFLISPEAQTGFSIDEVPPQTREAFIDEPFPHLEQQAD